MKKINLIKDQGVVKVDNDDYPLLSRYNWYLDSSNTVTATIQGKQFSMHRLVLGASIGLKRTYFKDRDPLNCQKKNLGLLTRDDRLFRKRVYENPRRKTSKYQGVFWAKNMNKWCAKMMFNRENVYCEYFKTEDEAVDGYIKKYYEMTGIKKTRDDFLRKRTVEV